MGELGDQERESDSTTLGLVEKERLNLTMGEEAMALFEVKASFLFPRCVAWELWVWERLEWLGQLWGAYGSRVGTASPRFSGKKKIYT